MDKYYARARFKKLTGKMVTIRTKNGSYTTDVQLGFILEDNFFNTPYSEIVSIREIRLPE